MDNTNSSSSTVSSGRPSLGGNDRQEQAASSIRYVGAKEAKVPLPLVLVLLAALAMAIVAVRHYVQA